jgi:DNA-binding NarL/FixJ family response regulator
MNTSGSGKKRIVVCETQPVTAEGIRAALAACEDLEYLCALDSLSAVTERLRRETPDLLLIDKSFGAQAVLHWLGEQKLALAGTGIIIWGSAITEPEALRLLQLGVKGILRKSAEMSTLVACLRAVAGGANWMEDALFRDAPRTESYARSELTPRERQVLDLVEGGMKNREIARELGIRPGTVKIHLKHIFEKTGVRGRYGLALNNIRERSSQSALAGAPALAPPPSAAAGLGGGMPLRMR